MNMFMVTFARIRKRQLRVLNEPAGLGASLVAQSIKNLPAVLETWIRYLGREDPLEKEMATHSSVLAWRIPGTEEPGRLQSMGSVRCDLVTKRPPPPMNL